MSCYLLILSPLKKQGLAPTIPTNDGNDFRILVAGGAGRYDDVSMITVVPS